MTKTQDGDTVFQIALKDSAELAKAKTVFTNATGTARNAARRFTAARAGNSARNQRALIEASLAARHKKRNQNRKTMEKRRCTTKPKYKPLT
jgi:hypothetical protein